MKPVAVILSGSGYLDGSEIHESVSTLIALDELGLETRCFAPDVDQASVVDHLTGQSVPAEHRNALREAARIARGRVEALAGMDPSGVSAIVLPGGYGAAKNLCTFASEGAGGRVIADLEGRLRSARAARVPIGAICIAPAILALAFKGAGLRLTVGGRSEASAEIEKLGHAHVECAADRCVVDSGNGIVTTPAYMTDAPLAQIFQGIRALAAELRKMVLGVSSNSY